MTNEAEVEIKPEKAKSGVKIEKKIR